MKKPLRVVALCRVSTEEQKGNTSLSTQEQDIRDYCRIHGHDIVHLIADDETGARPDQRHHFRQAMQWLHQGKADGLIVWKLDRYTRNVLQGLAVFCSFERHGWQLISVRDQIDTSTPMGRAFFQIALVFSELQRNDVVWRTKLGQQAKAARGEYAGGTPPFGWDAQEGKLVANISEQAIIRTIKAWHAGGKSYREIAMMLNKQGSRTKRHREWNHEQVRRVLDNKRTLTQSEITAAMS